MWKEAKEVKESITYSTCIKNRKNTEFTVRGFLPKGRNISYEVPSFDEFFLPRGRQFLL